MKTIYQDDTVCLLSILHPACAFAPGADVARTFAEHSRADEYQREAIETAQCEQHENYLRGISA